MLINMSVKIYSPMIILTLQKTTSTPFQTSIDISIVKLASVFPCQEVQYFKSWMKTDKLEQQVVQEKKMDNKGGKYFKNCMIRNKKNQSFVSIYVMKEDLHTYEETPHLPCVKPAKL